jgi:hypothetical protein
MQKAKASWLQCLGKHLQTSTDAQNTKRRPHPLRCERQFFPMPSR